MPHTRQRIMRALAMFRMLGAQPPPPPPPGARLLRRQDCDRADLSCPQPEHMLLTPGIGGNHIEAVFGDVGALFVSCLDSALLL